jgi:hypothetical protein
MAYIGNSPGVASQRIVSKFTATASQTTFTPTSGYTVGYLDVYLNGVKLINGEDYTASNGSTFVLASGAASGDVIEAVAYLPRGLSDGYTKAEADARYMDINAVTLPSQSGNSGKYLTTDGSDASWGTVDLSTKVSKTGDTMTGDLIVNANVGVGASSPTHKFHLDNGTTDGTLFKINNEEVGLLLAVNGTGTTYGREVSLNATRVDAGSSPSLRLAGQGAIVFAVDANTERMRIDSAGRVTMPYQPYFEANFNGNLFNVSANSKITQNREIYDLGGCYDPSNSRFTAPVTGRYFFSFHTIAYGNYINGHIMFRVNGSAPGNTTGTNHHFSSNEGSSAWHSVNMVHVLRLSAGDYVEVWNGGTSIDYHGNAWNRWTGYLLG